MPFRKSHMSLLAAAAAFCLAPAVSAQTAQAQVANVTPLSAPSTATGAIAKFIPQQQTRNTRLDYGVLNDALFYSVLPLGPSTRRHMGRTQANTGSRQLTGHRSRYRLEGSRISFSLLNDEYKTALTEYQKDLERIGSEINIPSLSRNEQLAYWLNLHNVTMIAQIVENYPVRRPSKIKVNGISVDKAKILKVNGVSLSLQDIRERIVYPNWKNPNVIYGFFRGDIGSPAILDYAFTGENLADGLRASGEDFVNSLRGVHEASKTRNVSRVYQEAAPFYFKNFESDLQNHLLQYAREDVKAEIVSAKPMKIDFYDDVVADLVGGSRPNIASSTIVDRAGNPITMSYELMQLMREFEVKRETLKKRGLIQRGGTVIIQDIATPSTQYDPNVDPASSTYSAPPTDGL